MGYSGMIGNLGIYKVYILCRLCVSQEETDHVVFECDALERNRRELNLALNNKLGRNTDIFNAILFKNSWEYNKFKRLTCLRG